MKLIITSKNKKMVDFIYTYLPDYIYNLFISSVDTKRLDAFNKELSINSFNVLSRLLHSLIISKINDISYDISINRNVKLNNTSLITYLNFITCGNRSIKGYPIIYNIFKYVAENIDDIYEQYERGE